MIAIIIILALILLIEVPPFIRDKNTRGLYIYLPIFALIATLSIMQVVGTGIKSPLYYVDRFLGEVLHIGYQ